MDKQLSKLLQEVCQHPQGSKQWRRAMHLLLIKLQTLPGLLKSSHPDYLEALNRTWEKVSRDICSEFKTGSESLEKSLVTWINGYLYWRIRDLYTCKSAKLFSLDAKIYQLQKSTTLIEQVEDTEFKTYTLQGLDGYIEQLQSQETERLATKILNYIEKDPQKLLKNCYARAYSNCNCQLISQKRYLTKPPNTFAEIAQELNIPHRKLMNHWYGRCMPLLQQIAKDLGYRTNE